MFSEPKRPEIDEHTIKLIIGIIALTLANLTSFFSPDGLQSISDSYHKGYWSRDIFVGFLFAIFALLLAYNGKTGMEKILGRIAACTALLVAMFPCECVTHTEIIPHVHGISAAIMFVILAFFCHAFFKRARSKDYPQAKVRSYIYAICGVTIVTVILILGADHFIKFGIEKLTFYGERSGLIAFGVSWLTASRVLPFITRKDERNSLLSN